MYKLAEKQKVQAGTTAAPAQRETGAPTAAVPNSAMASMADAGESGYANPNLDQMMQARMGGLHEDMAAEKEAVDVGRQFMDSTDVVGDMSRAYGQDLSGVRLHTDPGAAQKAEERGVDAFSTGRDIYFAQGAYDRSDPASRGLLAHELSHSLQQGVGGDASVMAQSAPVGAEQGGIRDWFRRRKAKKTEITEPQLKEQGTWGQELFDKVMNQRDADLAAPGADQAAVQANFMERMKVLSNMEGGGGITYGKMNYNNIQGAALHQIVNGTSTEDMRANTELQDRVISGFNSRMGDEMAKYNGTNTPKAEVKAGLFRGNSIGEQIAYNNMLMKMTTPDVPAAMYAASKQADPNPVKGCIGSTPEETIPASSYGAEEAIQALSEKVENDPAILRVLNEARPAFADSDALGNDEDTSEALMNIYALRGAAPLYTQMKTDQNQVGRGQAFMREVNTGTSDAKKRYAGLLNRTRPRR